MATNDNSYVKWWQFISALISIVVLATTITLSVTSSIMSRVDATRGEALACIEKVRAEACTSRENISNKVDNNTKYYYIINERLARIEAKLGIN